MVLSVGLEQILAILYAVIVVLLILFQCCLIAGAPWGQLTQGGAMKECCHFLVE